MTCTTKTLPANPTKLKAGPRVLLMLKVLEDAVQLSQLTKFQRIAHIHTVLRAKHDYFYLPTA